MVKKNFKNSNKMKNIKNRKLKKVKNNNKNTQNFVNSNIIIEYFLTRINPLVNNTFINFVNINI